MIHLSVSAPFQNTFVGLTNLGATCYVNTFLQVWFHNLELRRSLYQCHNARAQEHNIECGAFTFLVYTLRSAFPFQLSTHNVYKLTLCTFLYMMKAFPFSDYEPESICEHLQYLFALLQNSNRKYIDPSGLVKALGLDTGQQQVSPWMKLSEMFHNALETQD